MGVGVGNVVGVVDGSLLSVGDLDGFNVGGRVGKEDGRSVGVFEGTTVTVGLNDGVKVGSFVGFSDG